MLSQTSDTSGSLHYYEADLIMILVEEIHVVLHQHHVGTVNTHNHQTLSIPKHSMRCLRPASLLFYT